MHSGHPVDRLDDAVSDHDSLEHDPAQLLASRGTGGGDRIAKIEDPRPVGIELGDPVVTGQRGQSARRRAERPYGPTAVVTDCERAPSIPAGCNAKDLHSCDAGWVAVRCLIVDDNPRFLWAARTLLEREGLTVSGVARTSADALRQAATLRPDVVLVDVVLGDESGFELARRLVAIPAQVVVILISTHSEAELDEAIRLSPAAGFLAKSDLSAEAILGLVDDASARRGR